MFSRAASAREREPDTYLPYVGHATPGVILLDDGGLLAMIRIGGIAWETADPDEVNARHAQRNILLRNIASDRLVLATHVVRSIEWKLLSWFTICSAAWSWGFLARATIAAPS